MVTTTICYGKDGTKLIRGGKFIAGMVGDNNHKRMSCFVYCVMFVIGITREVYVIVKFQFEALLDCTQSS